MAPRPHVRAAGERGQVIVIFALAITGLLAAAGLAFDIGRFYSERRFLQNSADSAALAAANSIIRGDSYATAETIARDILTRNYLTDPNGRAPALPSATPIYESGHAGDVLYLLDGIVITGGDIRVAVRNEIDYTFGRFIGLVNAQVSARARVKLDGDILPIAVRHFVNAPGSGSGVYPCVDDDRAFTDYFATADTACLGTDTDDTLRVDPTAGAAFDALNPDNDRTNHGPIVAIMGDGAVPDNGADFRGYVALDIRNFANTTSQLYYNGVNPGDTASVLKDLEAQWLLAGGYPGPMFPPAISPPDPNDQVAILNGNSTGTGIDAFNTRFIPGDLILVAVYPGVTLQIPDFSMAAPSTISLPTTGTVANAGSFKVGRNQSFSGTVDLTTVADSGDPFNPMVTGTLLGGATPITYTPNPVTPSLGSGQTVDMTNVTTSGAPDGIYSLWLRGEAGSPYLSIKYLPFAVKVGTVSRDFSIAVDASEKFVALGGTVTYNLTLKRSGPSFGGTGVNLSLEALPGQTLPTGLGAVTFSPSNINPATSGTPSVLTIDVGTAAPGQYTFVVRATGLNGDATGRRVTHLLPITVDLATSSSGGNQEYIDITGFAVMRVVQADSNTIAAYAITPMVADMNDPLLRRGQTARLMPWN
ncbi:MAG TPA: pilus assembly protein TadG-related protein [Candidatus Polarisedimenticolia bacterium]|nr:pilus assembly protein TadG-related protein [Candidatus Polarisedimenticolia bacterium]